MALENNSHFFSTLQSDYAAWLSQILLSSLYEDLASRKKIVAPNLFKEVVEDDIFIPPRVRDSQGILHQLAEDILNSETKPSRDIMEVFLVTFENFQASLQTLENGLLFADFGIDELTGLATQDKMIPELERELERRSRRGQPFCFAISRIDGEAERKNSQNIILTAKAIQKTIRSFDDAYVMGEGEFLSILKHSDSGGGIKFIGRLNNSLLSNEEITFTVSSIIAEPLPGDDILQLISDVKRDLDGMSTESKGAMGQYEEASQLSQYLKSLKEKK
jgi:diguanylate cyclase